MRLEVVMGCRHPLLVLIVLIALVGAACSPNGSVGDAASPTSAPEAEIAADDEGYTVIAPLGSTTTYLIDGTGAVVHSWTSDTTPGDAVYLVDGGNLLRTGSLSSEVFDAGGGGGGLVELRDWDSNVVWSFEFNTDTYRAHNDVELLPSGNVLMILWELKTVDEARAAGIDARDDLWADMIWELDPATGEIVWEWRVWDHLSGDASDLGRLDVAAAGVPRVSDWNHVNSVAYNGDLDQIVLSSRNQNEIWIIDHDTTTDEAAGESGDFLWRWGNPGIYGGAGGAVLSGQHDAQWIADGLAGAGNLLIFNNGKSASSVVEITPPLRDDTTYAPPDDDPSAQIQWSYEGDPPESFYAVNISGAQRLPGGNTLIDNGPAGHVFEVTAEGKTVWNYVVAGKGLLFRAPRYFASGDALMGRDLVPAGPVPEQAGPGGGRNSQP